MFRYVFVEVCHSFESELTFAKRTGIALATPHLNAYYVVVVTNVAWQSY